MRMTTASAENSSVPSMPLKALLESAAVPSGPAIWTFRPSAPDSAMARSELAAGAAAFQPDAPRLIGTMVSIALPSVEVNGPAIWPCTTPATPPKRAASATAFALSAAVTPDGRSYTTTAGYTLGETTCDRRFRTCVDSAFAGSQAEASFFSAPISFPDSGPATATMISQPTSTSHLARRPPDTVAIPRRKLTAGPPSPVSVLPSIWTPPRSGNHRN